MKLAVVTAVFNPQRYKRRYELFRLFTKHIADSGADLFVIEHAFGDRPFVITEANNPFHHQIRSRDEWFMKEALLQILVERLPPEYGYVASVDADILFNRENWASETVEMLQHYPVVQMFSQAANLAPDGRIIQLWNSFGWSYQQRLPFLPGARDYTYWHPGFAWAYRRDFLAQIGLMDRLALGSGDHHMAASLIGRVDDTVHGLASDSVKRYCFEWQERVQQLLRAKGDELGYVAGLIRHEWHGKFRDRRYGERWQILIDNDFDPYRDLWRGEDGMLHLTDRKPHLRADIRDYLRARNEDSIDYDSREITV